MDGSQLKRFELLEEFIRIISIDFSHKRIFYINNKDYIKLSPVFSIDYNGEKRRFFGEISHLSQFALIGYFNDYLYIKVKNEIHRYKIDNKSLNYNESLSKEIIVMQNNTIDYFKIYDKTLERNVLNICENNNCSHICIPINDTKYRCVCPMNELSSSGYSCDLKVNLIKNLFIIIYFF